ncbi:MAG TPA: DNA recombination protein RmuC [Mycobacteriales bacterium]|nr:DNA recombination protein RmuC [Mycobacteriales bacterium]
MDPIALLISLVTLAAGFAAGWALARGRNATPLAERDAARADVERLRAERDRAEAHVREAQTAAADANARLESERSASADKITLLQQAQEQLRDAFARLSSEALQRSNQQFLELADSRFKQAGAPLTETLGKVEVQLREIEKSRAGAQQALVEQIERVRLSGEELKHETAALVSALRKPQARGRWGELQLRRCVEFAGMIDRCDFVEQESVSTSDGMLRPDLVVKLVGGKSIVVDSKVTLAAYLEAHDATDDLVREERLAAHARHLRTHVDQLAAKAYWSQFSAAPEFVVLFVPGDAFLAAALDRDADLLDYAFGKRIHIATPTTLISVLRTCAYAWQQEALAANAREVFELGRELYSRISKLGAKVDTLGKRLGSAVGAYNDTVASLESRVLPQARKLKDLKVVDEDLSDPKPVEDAVRPVAAAELVAAVEDQRAIVPLPAAADALLDRPEDYGLVTDESQSGNGRATG